MMQAKYSLEFLNNVHSEIISLWNNFANTKYFLLSYSLDAVWTLT